MATPAERKALLFLSCIIVLGGFRRLYQGGRARPQVGTESVRALERQISAVDSAIQSRRRSPENPRKTRPKKKELRDAVVPGSAVDLDVASAKQIETLRGIGPGLAERIVRDRDSLGAFGSLEGLVRVRGIGPALAEKLAPNVTFSGVPRPVNTVVSRRSVKGDPKRKSRRRERVY